MTKKKRVQLHLKMIAIGIFCTLVSWFLVDRFIVPISIGKYVLIELVIAMMGLLYDWEKKKHHSFSKAETDVNSEKV
jgi:hypothetical protein